MPLFSYNDRLHFKNVCEIKCEQLNVWNGKNNKKCGSGGRWAAYRYSMYGMRHLLIINHSFTVYWHVEEDNSFCFLKSIDSIFQVNQQYILNQWTTALENEFMTIFERRRWTDRASGCSKSLGRPQCFDAISLWAHPHFVYLPLLYRLRL